MQRKIFSAAKLLLFITLLALILRFINLHQLQQRDYFALPEMTPDSHYNHETAQKIADGDLLLGKDPYYSAPLYPYFLAIFYSLLGPIPLYPLIFQAILGSLSPLLIFWLDNTGQLDALQIFSEIYKILASYVFIVSIP